ncbi:hypothetical protein LWI29_023447 [Acer saccharum]|uniref:Uncharacterized protein n=1 Tax=Acer saccharum TaxID=4024 RepID=A0AA39WA86_ACESA|nr:hypothetical protein LWI29_023447 [Acer saccharum]
MKPIAAGSAADPEAPAHTTVQLLGIDESASWNMELAQAMFVRNPDLATIRDSWNMTPFNMGLHIYHCTVHDVTGDETSTTRDEVVGAAKSGGGGFGQWIFKCINCLSSSSIKLLVDLCHHQSLISGGGSPDRDPFESHGNPMMDPFRVGLFRRGWRHNTRLPSSPTPMMVDDGR